MKINKFLLKAKNRAKSSHSSGSKALRKVKVKSTKDVKNKILIKKIFKISLMAVILIFLIGAIGLTILVIKYANELPPPGTPFTRSYAQTTSIYSRGGTLLYAFHGSQNREWVNINKVSKTMQWAVIAAEDKNFYHEPFGISFTGIARAFYHDFILRSPGLQGGSTITQQLVKDTVLSSQRTFQRKLEEIILTIEISQKYSKQQVLEAYLNEVYFGGNAYGIQVASQDYFGKNPNQLTLAQCAMLAGIIQAPSFYSPLFGTNPKYAIPRADYVLNRMLADKSETGVTAAQVNQAKKQLLHMQYNTSSLSQNIKDPWFVYYVKNQLEQKYGISAVQDGGWKVYTTLSWKMQQVAQSTVTSAVNYLVSSGLNAHNGSLVSVDPNNGEILAMVGAYKYGVSLYNGQMNGDFNAALAPRQPGSSIKPFLYLTVFQDLGFAPSTFMPDLYININGYSPTDWNNVYNGPMNIKTALRESRNVPAVKTLYALGTSKFITELHKFGFTGLSSYKNDLSIAIGAADTTLLQNTEAYGVLANGGVKYPTVSILKIVNPQGKIIYQYKPQSAGKKIVQTRYTYLVDRIISKFPTLYYSPSPIYKGYSNAIASKTGTTNSNRDLVLMGYTQSLATGMWAGNDNNAPTTYNSWGEDLSSFWNSYMLKVLPMMPPSKPFQAPPGITTSVICSDSGLLASSTTPCNKVVAHFAQGQLPKPDNVNIVKDVCTQNPAELATSSDIASGDYVQKVFIQLQEYSPIFQPALNAWEKSAGPTYNIPTTYCTTPPPVSSSSGTIQFTVSNPTTNENFTVGPNNINVTGSITTQLAKATTSVSVSINNSSGSSVGSGSTVLPSGSSNFSISIPTPSSTGQYSVLITVSNGGNSGTMTIPINVESSSSNSNFQKVQPQSTKSKLSLVLPPL
jgi:penicillin-binding protein 1A